MSLSWLTELEGLFEAFSPFVKIFTLIFSVSLNAGEKKSSLYNIIARPRAVLDIIIMFKCEKHAIENIIILFEIELQSRT